MLTKAKLGAVLLVFVAGTLLLLAEYADRQTRFRNARRAEMTLTYQNVQRLTAAVARDEHDVQRKSEDLDEAEQEVLEALLALFQAQLQGAGPAYLLPLVEEYGRNQFHVGTCFQRRMQALDILRDRQEELKKASKTLDLLLEETGQAQVQGR